jgi:hypothetical protein
MTLIGHSITGAAVAAVVVPSRFSTGSKMLCAVLFAVLANTPDFRLPGWGHDRYDISHSIFMSVAIMAVLAAPFMCSSSLRRKVGGRVVVAVAALTWLSHLLLDTFYNHGQGIGLFWPVSSANVALPIPWFETVSEGLPYFDSHTLRVWMIEFACYSMVFLTIVGIRMAMRMKKKSLP